MKESATDLVIQFYCQIIRGDYNEDDEFDKDSLTTARCCAMVHLELIGMSQSDIYEYISNDNNWK